MDEARRLKDYIEAAADWVWETDADLRFSRMSPSRDISDEGWSRHFLGRLADALPAASDGDGKALLKALRTRRPFRDLRFACRDGAASLHLFLSGLPLFEDGRFTGYRGVGRDAAALMRAEAERAETAAMLRATLDQMEQGVLVLDAELRIELWNARLCQLLEPSSALLWIGRPVDEMIREHAQTVRGPAEAGIAFIRRGAAARHPGTREVKFGDGRIFEMRLTPRPDGGVILACRDVSERRRVELELRRAKEEAELASRSKGEFLANMTHELRTPLNAVIGFADILTGEVFGPLGDRRYLDYAVDIRESGRHLLKLINDVLDVSKIEFGKIVLNEEAVEIAPVVEACARLMRDRVEAAELVMTCALPPALPLVHCDELRFKQILLNLLSNAVKFTPAGGRVTIRAALEDGAIGISVQDTGIGIAAADLEKALRPFGQIDSRLSRKYQGTGLGLPLAKSMIELHGGRLDIASTPGSGTTATIWFPAERILFPSQLSGAFGG